MSHAAVTATSGGKSSGDGALNTAYVRSLPGLLKVGQTVSSTGTGRGDVSRRADRVLLLESRHVTEALTGTTQTLRSEASLPASFLNTSVPLRLRQANSRDVSALTLLWCVLAAGGAAGLLPVRPLHPRLAQVGGVPVLEVGGSVVPRRPARLPLHASVPTAGQDEMHQLATDGETTAVASARSGRSDSAQGPSGGSS